MKESNTPDYAPEADEVNDAIVFMSNCSVDDLVTGWVRISSEWDFDSVVKIHRSLCETGRINHILGHFSDNHS